MTIELTTRREEQDDARSQDGRRKKSMKITVQQWEEDYETHNMAERTGRHNIARL